MKFASWAGMTVGTSCLLVSLCPSFALAQSSDDVSSAAQVTSGPMTVERIRSGFLVAPDFKVTRFDGQTSSLAGVYGGWLNDRTFFIGGGGYWLTDRSRAHDMAYGGVVVGWFAQGDRRVGFGAKGLIGGGEATLADDVTILRPPIRGVPQPSFTTTVRFRNDFFIAEPEADVLVQLNRHLKLTGGVGYRLVSGVRGSDRRVRGTTGSVALQIGGGS